MTDLPRPGARTTAFISHHSSHYEAARTVKAALARAGIDGWLAPDDVEPGTPFDVAIVEQLERSDVIILLLSARADQSRHVKRELMLADESNKPVFPVRLEPVEAAGLAYWLKEHQWIDWFDGRGDRLDRLITAIERRVGAKGAPPPPPAPRERDEPTPAPAKRGMGAGRLLLGAFAIGAVGLIAIASVIGTPSEEGNSTVTRSLTYERRTNDQAADEDGAADSTLIEPGTWSLTRDVVDISFPQLDPELEKQISLTIENDPNPEDCVSEATARRPDVKLFDPKSENNCSLNDFRMAGGRLSGFANCTLPDSNGLGKVNFAFSGTYTRTSIKIDNDVTMTQPGGMMKFRTRDHSRWVKRQCDPA